MAKFPRKTLTLIRFWAPAIIWAGIIFLFSAEQTGTASRIYWQDFVVKKTAHIVEYAMLTTLLFRAFTNSGTRRRRAAFLSMGIAALYAVTDETHQAFTPGREPTARDIVFDTIGAGLAIYAIWNILPKAPKRLKNWAKDFQLI